MKRFGFVIPVIFALAVFLSGIVLTAGEGWTQEAGAGGMALGSRGAEGQGGEHLLGFVPQPNQHIGAPRQGNGAVAPVKPEVEHKMKKLHVPFIANEGQADEQVKYYANTFAGSVFVTKDGEIVYSLPSGRDVPAGASQESGRGLEAGGLGSRGAEGQGGKVGWYGQAPLVRAESAFVANGYLPFSRVDNANCPQCRVFAKSLIAAYLPELQESTGRDTGTVSLRAAYPPELQEGTANSVGTRCPCPPRLAHLSDSQKGTDKQSLSMPPIHSALQNPQSPIRGVAIKEHLVGGKIGEIRGEAPSATTVSYFKGNDPSQWKTNLATAELVNLGEVYEGIDLRLKAYGNNVEKLFTVKPGANPGQIKISLSGAKDCGIENPNSQIQNPKLQINPAGELVAETELGAVKFTKPVAYQEIDGKRVEVACEYAIAEGGTNLEFGFWNLDWFPYSEINNFRFPKSALQNPNSKSAINNTQHPTPNSTYL